MEATLCRLTRHCGIRKLFCCLPWGQEIIMILINFLALYKKLKLSPLAFLRGQTAKEKKGPGCTPAEYPVS